MANTDPIAGTYNRILNLRAPAQDAPTPQPSAPGQDTDLMALLNGDMIPMLENLLGYAYEEYIKPPPQQGDFTDSTYSDGTPYTAAEQWADAVYAWNEGAQDRLDAVTKIASQLNQARKLGTGSIELGDGTLITQEMLNSSDPTVAAQVRAEYENRAREVFNSYNQLMNETGLAQYQVDLSATSVENDRRAKEFESALDAFDSGLDWDKANIGRTADVINRELSGMQESRARADLTTQALLSAAPWATTPGKTDFTAADMGGGVEALARQGGIPAGVPLIRFPTTVNIDPQALMAQGDAALGVGQGPLPAVPDLTTPRSAVPLAPTYMQGPAAPPLSMPVPPTTAQEQIRAQQALIDTARLLGGRLGRIL